MWNPPPPQGFTKGQGQIIIGRPPIPAFGTPQGIGQGIPVDPNGPLLALFPPVADTSYEFYKFYQIKKNQIPVMQPVNDWFNILWQKRISITINAGQVPSTQTNFPVLINKIIPSLIGQQLDELRFTKADNIQLDYEIQKFDTVTGELIAWVRMPTVQDGDIIRIYYDNNSAVDEQNPTAVWDSNYESMYHLNGNGIDSTIHAKDMTLNGVTTVPAKIGDGLNFTGTVNDYLIRNPYLNFPSTEITVDLWVKTSGSGDGMVSYSRGIALLSNYFLIFNQSDIVVNIDSMGFSTSLAINNDTFRFLTVTWRSSDGELKMYDGKTLVFTGNVSTGITLISGGSLVLGQEQDTIGGGFDGNQAYNGIMQEVSISNIVRDIDYISTKFNNQNDNDTFFTIDLQEENLVLHSPLVVIDTLGAGILQEASGFDIRVFDSTGSPLSYEVQDVNIATGEFIIWVDMPNVTDGEFIQLTFGKPTATDGQTPSAVYDVNYKSVYHMNGTGTDSTSNSNNLATFGTTTVPAKIGDGTQYNGTTNDYSIKNPFSGFPTTELTCEYWIKTTDAPFGMFHYARTGAVMEFSTFVSNVLNMFLWVNDDLDNSLIVSINDGVFHHIVVTWRSSDGLTVLYIDGKNVFSTTLAVGASLVDGGALVLAQEQDSVGGGFDGNQALDGILDEVRLSNIERSADYVTTTYNNQKDNDAFWFKTPLLTVGEDNFLVDHLGNNIVAEGQ